MSTYKQSDSINELSAALACAQRLMEGASKDSSNPFFRSKYADLSSVWLAIREPLGANGISVIQLPSADGSKVTITTVLSHSSGQWISSDLTMTAKRQMKDGGGWEELDTPQAIGSTITYARRYALAAICGVAPEDDDAEAAQGRSAAPVARPAQGRYGHEPSPQEAESMLRQNITKAAGDWLNKFTAVKHPVEFKKVMGSHGYSEISEIPANAEKAKSLFEDLRIAYADCKTKQ